MDKEKTALVQKFIELLGFNTFEIIGIPCTGKWRGTTDYCLILDGKFKFFVSNKMKYFEEKLKERIQIIESFNMYKNELLQVIRKQVEKDNEEAKKENLLPAKVVDLKLNTATNKYFMYFHLVLEVDGVKFKHIETGLHYAIEGNTLNEYFQRKNANRRFTAACVKEPAFIFANVRFSHLDDLYKIKE